VNCAFCHKQIAPETTQKQLAQQVVAWRAPGSSTWHRAKATGSFAHLGCLIGGVGEQGQLSLHDIPHARSDDFSTSQDAGDRLEAEEGKTTEMRPGSIKHLALKLIAEKPRTANEIERLSGKRGIWKRVSDLKNAGLIEPTGISVDEVTDRGNLIWSITDRGRYVLGRLDAGDTVKLEDE
jgi:hypothetical protein